MVARAKANETLLARRAEGAGIGAGEGEGEDAGSGGEKRGWLSLIMNNASTSPTPPAFQAECLIALDPDTNAVVGTLDIVDGQSAADLSGDPQAKGLLSAGGVCYMENVCVAESERRRGVATALVDAAVEAVAKWDGAQRIVAHVARSNSGAAELYRRAGFEPVDAERGWAGRSDAADAANYDPHERILLQLLL